MRTLTSMAVLLAMALVISACSGSSGEPAATTADAGGEAGGGLEITIEDFDFSGPETAAVGDTVTITNEDAVAHTWTAVDDDFDSGNVAEGETFEYTFEEAGDFDYFCTIHPEMEGTITVEG